VNLEPLNLGKMEINEIEILSVGVDVGSSTSHLVFSNLLLKRDQRSVTRRFNIEQRDIIYEGKIIHTPLLDDNTIDIKTLTEFFKAEYELAGIDPGDIQTGAVIVTGESARKQNARQIAQALSNDAGRFVAATAGPNFESLIAAMGSGAAARSKENNNTVLSCDIGGGTSNIAVSRNGARPWVRVPPPVQKKTTIPCCPVISAAERPISLYPEMARLWRPAVSPSEGGCWG
jgi:ethanolamine utilization protein EutA